MRASPPDARLAPCGAAPGALRRGVPDTRRHRGPHPEDEALFAPTQLPGLREAVADLSWLLSRGYKEGSALKLVGDRLALTERQRRAVLRSACSDASLAGRRGREVSLAGLAGQPVAIDGFNLIATLEVALSGGFVLCGRDGCRRDIAGLHGSYRRVEETAPAARLVARTLLGAGAGPCTLYLDAPVSNSGRLRALLLDEAAALGWAVAVELVPSPDALLAASPAVVVTADSVILDRCARWCNLARAVIDAHVPGARLVELAPPP